MMKRFTVFFAGILTCSLMIGCGSSAVVQAPNAAAEVVPADVNADAPSVDCSKLKVDLAENCFQVTAFDEDGKTPLHIMDEAGQDLGEIDQAWAKSYCDCYADLAFKTFGCLEIAQHQQLDDESYDKLYEPIIASCSEISAPDDGTAAPAAQTAPGTEAAPAAQTAPGTEAAPAAQTAPGTEAAPAAQASPGTETAPAAQAAPGTETAPAAQAAPGTETAPAAQTAPAAGADPAK